MGILIKGMKMPKSCHECMGCTAGFCEFATGWQGRCPWTGRPEWCPLVEVPDHAVICGTKADGIPVMMFIQPESKEEKDEHID